MGDFRIISAGIKLRPMGTPGPDYWKFSCHHLHVGTGTQKYLTSSDQDPFTVEHENPIFSLTMKKELPLSTF